MAAAAAVMGSSALAGCDDLSSPEFEADPVGLPEGIREELAMDELARDSQTTTREIDQIDGEVSITNQYAVYDRAIPDEPSLVEEFIARVGVVPAGWSIGAGTNVQAGAGANPAGGAVDAAVAASLTDRHGPMRAASVVPLSAVGVEEMTLDVFEEAPTVAGDAVSLLVPGGIAGDDAVEPSDVLVMVPGTAIPGSDWVPGSDWIPSTTWFPGSRWFPGSSWIPGSDWIPSTNWFPGSKWSPDDPTSLRVVAVTGDGSFEETFGRSLEEVDGRPVEDGEPIPAENTVIAAPGDVLTPPGIFPGGGASPLYDAGYPAPLGGATYGLGVLATPNAEVAGNSANPLTGMSFEELLTHDAAREMLRDAGVTDADNVEWLAGPIEASDVPDGTEFSDWPDGTEFAEVSILDESAESSTYAGVVSGDAHPWLVVVNVGRASPDDVVVAASVQRTPIGSAESGANGIDMTFPAGWIDRTTAATGNNPFLDWTGRGAGTSAVTFEELDYL